MAEVVQDTEEQHQVEPLPAEFAGEVVDVAVQRLNLRAEFFAGEVERVPADVFPQVGGDDAFRPASFAFEGEQAVPAADVQDRPPGQVIGYRVEGNRLC